MTNKAIILLNDTIDHGGKVLIAAGSYTYKGIPVAGETDSVERPKCNGVFPIVESSENLKSYGKVITHQLNRRHVLEIQVIKNKCACYRDITLSELQEILPNVPQRRLEYYLNAFNQGFNKFDITTCRGKAHFLAQVFHESGKLRYTKEIGGENESYSPWYGRGLIQLTHQRAYRQYRNYIGEDVTSSNENRDKLLSSPHSVLSAFWFYKVKNPSVFNSAANDDFNKVTALINGGFNGYDDRLFHLKKAINALKAEHLNQLLSNDEFEFASSSIYNNKINSFAWGLWHDPSTKKQGTAKDSDKALRGYERVQELITANPFRRNELEQKMYGIKKVMSPII
ncbi:PAAR domain-containing protein [Xenorhabdus griffiniae]|uniref:PAAR domain-containing protein n=1 Tax=Xenorhabdus griffiniae TaxID=351672 RepID=UPI0030CEEAC6